MEGAVAAHARALEQVAAEHESAMGGLVLAHENALEAAAAMAEGVAAEACSLCSNPNPNPSPSPNPEA
jgi:hypothetical protein